jgi:hypothetical protein
MAFRAFPLALAFSLAAASAAAEGSGPSVGGSIEARPVLSWTAASGSLTGPDYGSTASLGLELSLPGQPGPLRASGGASIEASILAGCAAKAAEAAAAAGLLSSDTLFAPALSGTDALAVGPALLAAFRVRSLWAKLDTGWASLSAGRQLLSYGRGALWSPVDVFSSLEAGLLSNARRGVDSLRMRLPFGDTGLVDAVAAPQGRPAAGRYLLRASSLLAPGLDSGVLGAWDGAKEAWLAGADAKLDLGMGPSLYGELLCAMPAAGGAASCRAAAGADWSLGELVFAAEYYYNGDVSASADPYGAGAHNLYAGISWQALDLAAISAHASWDLSGKTGKAVLSCVWQAAQDAEFALFAAASGSAVSSASITAVQAGADIKLNF